MQAVFFNNTKNNKKNNKQKIPKIRDAEKGLDDDVNVGSVFQIVEPHCPGNKLAKEQQYQYQYMYAAVFVLVYVCMYVCSCACEKKKQ